MCGMPLERADSLHENRPFCVNVVANAEGDRVIQMHVGRCPQCNEPISAVDCTDLEGHPLFIPNISDWARERRRARGWPEN
jgi:uncharacterized protein with PIN domain